MRKRHFGRLSMKEVIVSLQKTRWICSLFPTLLAWSRSGTIIRVLAEEIRGNDIEQRQEGQRRRLLSSLAAQFEVKKSLPLTGFVLKGALPQEDAAVLYTPDAIGDRPIATFYSGLLNSPVIDLAYNALIAALHGSAEPKTVRIVQYDGDFATFLKESVALYKRSGVEISMEAVPIKDIQVLTPKIREYKLRQIECLVSIFAELDFSLFEPLEVIFADGKRSVVAPPVVEFIDGKYFVIEGNTRCFFCFQNDKPTLLCAVVRNVGIELPRPPYPLAHASITAHEKNVIIPNRNLFRPIEESIRPY